MLTPAEVLYAMQSVPAGQKAMQAAAAQNSKNRQPQMLLDSAALQTLQRLPAIRKAGNQLSSHHTQF